MSVFRIFKETTVPSELIANAMYLIGRPENPDELEVFVTDNAGEGSRWAVTKADVQTMIDTAVTASSGGMVIVDDIAARDALTPTNAQSVMAVDASGDPTVGSGYATYIYRATTETWIKTGEGESLDLVLAWGSLTGRPTADPAAIDDAATKRHSHANKTQLDKIGESEGAMTYNGVLPRIGWDTTNW